MLFIGVIPLFKAQFTPYIHNFHTSEAFLNGQNWDISASEDGTIYSANTNGLLSYNGLAWQLFQLPNKTTIRSVLALKDKIYTGSYQEFGYWEKNAFGILDYHTLTGSAPKINFQNEEIWQILPFKNTIAFRSFYALYIFDGKKISSIVAPSSIISISNVNDELWVATLNHGIFTLKNLQLIPLIQDSRIIGQKVIGAQVLDEDIVLLGTELQGIYQWTNGKLLPYELSIGNEIKKYQLNKFMIHDRRIYLGTIQNGVYYQNQNQNWVNLNRKNGIENNTVLAQCLNHGQLWIGLDSGISSIEMSSENLFYNDFSGKLGTTYDLINQNNNIYIGSNTGLYLLNAEGALSFIGGTQGQVWNLTNLEGDLLCGHNNGTYLVKGNHARLISPYSGGYFIEKIPGNVLRYIQGTYAGFVKFQKVNSNWEVQHLGEPYIPIRYLQFEDDQTAWAVHANKGLFHVRFSKDFQSVEKSVQVKGEEWSDYNLRIYKIKNDIVLKTNLGWYIHDPILGKWKKSDYLNQTFGTDKKIISKPNPNFYVLMGGDNLDFRMKGDLDKSKFITPLYNPNREVVNDQIAGQFNDTLWFYNLKDGFRLINTSQAHNLNHKIFAPELNEISYDNHFVKLTGSNEYHIPFTHSNVKLWLSSPKNNEYKIQYSFADDDSLVWNTMNSDLLEFNHLYGGDNKLLFRTINNLNEKSGSISVIINVAPPWYLSKLAYLIYFIVLIAVFYYFYQLHAKKLEKEQLSLKNELVKEQEEKLKQQEIENEKKIIALKNQNLKREVKSKSKELANHSMALIRKNESLQEIKNILNNNRSLFKDPILFNKVISKIDISMKERKEEWEFFENNFSQVHDDFFETIQKKHPKLKKRDLKLSAYIKMNLATKEIAPLMNLSVRGVETHKYRLKKKLDLSNEENLSDYLRNLS